MQHRAQLFALSATELCRGYDNGDFKPEQVLLELADAMPDLDQKIQAWAHLDLVAARSQAANSLAGHLAGVPFAAKDNIDTADMPTAYGSSIHSGHQPGRDASCVAAMRLAGAILVGKTESTEFAHRHPGKTRNPWDEAHTPGGSSSGSAAAVAAGMVPIAFGTQTTGSVIRPAAYCGVVGYKPTYGDFNTCGVLPNTPGFDTIGTMTRCIEDVVLVRKALLDASIQDLNPVSVRAMRIGLCRSPYWEEADDEARAVLLDGAGALAEAGAELKDFTAVNVFEGLAEANNLVSGYEFARSLAHERLNAYAGLSEVLREGRMAVGMQATHADYVKGAQRLEKLRILMDDVMQEVDVLLTPPAPGAAPVGLESTGKATFNMAWTTLHTPAITLPVGKSSRGLPIGIQLIARRHADADLLDCAAAIFQELGNWRSGT